jgi:hypothetical protein
MAQKPHDARAIEGALLYRQQQTALCCRCSNVREMIARQRHPQHRRMALRRVGMDHAGQPIEASLVYKDEASAFTPALFLNLGQRWAY